MFSTPAFIFLGPRRVRHSVLTFLAESGVKPYALQAFARHADMGTTNRFYVHVNKLKLAREAVDVLAVLQGLDPAPLSTAHPFAGNGLATNGNRPQLCVLQ